MFLVAINGMSPTIRHIPDDDEDNQQNKPQRNGDGKMVAKEIKQNAAHAI